ncbi:MAG: DUF2971 domain-containing protein [Lachnospiraceae bacterium]|nr:DUF2971 domain-containing protein [Lachnospiraceae bacterium]
MDDMRDEKYYGLAVRAYMQVQNMKEGWVRSQRKLSDILCEDTWWKKLLKSDHLMIAKFIAKYDSQLQKICRDYGLEVKFSFRRDGEGSGEFILLEKETTLLYHYTSLETCLSILEHNTIYLMNSDYMNDIRERKYFRNVTQGYFENLLAGDRGVATRQRRFYSTFDNKFDYPAYLISFSEKNDDAAQWERYGDNGYGVCIGFSKSELDRICNNLKYLRLEKVEYSKKFRDDNFYKELIGYLRTGKCLNGRNLDDLLRDYYTECISHKHISFDAEQEIRLITGEVYDRKLSHQIEQFESSRAIKEVWKLDWDKLFSNNKAGFHNLIKKVTVGPRAEYDCELLEKHLQAKKYRAKPVVEQSDCPLRPMYVKGA